MKQWIYIAGGGRSGTTLLASLLADALDAFDCGELHLLWESLVNGRLCTCGVAVPRCPVWSSVASRVTEELGFAGNEDGAQIMRHRLRQRQLMLPRLPTPRHDELVLRRATENAIEEITDSPVVVDSSKLSSVLWTASKIDRPLTVVHVVRDPRAVAFSWARPPADPSLGGEPMKVKKAGRAAIDWLRANATTLRVLRHLPSVSHVALRYEDLASRPNEVLRSLAGRLETEPVGFPKAAGTKSHAVAGNPKRYVSDQVIRPDLRWQKHMRVTDKVVSTLPALPLLRRFSYPIWPR